MRIFNPIKHFFANDKATGILFCLFIAIPAWMLGRFLPLIGGPVFAIILGMLFSSYAKSKPFFQPGILFTSKKILQYAVILLGFGLNLNIVFETGLQSLPIILTTIFTALLIAALLQKKLHLAKNTALLIGVGSSICGGSAIAATAPVLEAGEEEVAQAISVIFFFNVIATLLFPALGVLLDFSSTSGEAFGIFCGTAINDTSSVTAAASTWDSMFHLGSMTLDKAVTVKLTRTLAIIPITLVLSYLHNRKQDSSQANKNQAWKRFPFFIIFFIAASLLTTILTTLGVKDLFFLPFKELSKCFIILAMGAIGLNTNFKKMIKNGWKPLFLGFSCWIGITIVSLFMQHLLNLW